MNYLFPQASANTALSNVFIFVSQMGEKWYGDLHFFNYKWDWAYLYGLLSLISVDVTFPSILLDL